VLTAEPEDKARFRFIIATHLDLSIRPNTPLVDLRQCTPEPEDKARFRFIIATHLDLSIGPNARLVDFRQSTVAMKKVKVKTMVDVTNSLQSNQLFRCPLQI